MGGTAGLEPMQGKGLKDQQAFIGFGTLQGIPMTAGWIKQGQTPRLRRKWKSQEATLERSRKFSGEGQGEPGV